MKKTPWIWAAALLLATGSAVAQPAPRKSYIVQLDEMPVAGYTGKVQGYAATKPATGRKLDLRASHVQAYIGYLDNRQKAALAAVGNVPVTHRYRVAFPGFAARLTDAEANALRGTAGVRAVTADAMLRPDTSRTPAFLGLSAPGGLWSQGGTGENVVIGIIDTGISPENPAFSDKVDASGTPVPAQQAGTVVYAPITNARPWAGTCQAGDGFRATDCNHKLIGARAYSAGLAAGGLVKTATEFNSPRDGDGHGSHTASTAGGNAGVVSSVNGQPTGTLAGMAPRARIAAYKVCWHYNGDGGTGTCMTTDSVAAIDQAVADGVDVINFSISGTRTSYLDPVEVSFFYAADAGVFVAASAGNSGPDNTVAHMSPWLTTVAASTHDRLMVADAVLGNVTYNGPSQQTGLGSAGAPKALILSTEAGVVPLASLNAVQQAALRLCFNAADLADASLLGSAAGANAALDPAKVTDKIVVCDRGTNARVNKSQAVASAGGAGMVLLNTSSNTLNDDAHFVPTVHLSHTVRTAVRTLAAGGAATGYFGPASLASGVVAPVMASFSSRGPSLASPHILKPDLTAPGVGILAATTYVPPDAAAQAAVVGGAYPAPRFDFLQGTSMSSPHVAGIAAALRGKHPSWSPAAIKSALMTTTTGVKLADGTPDPDRFGYGAGHVNPNAANAVGLVYDAGTPDYLAFLCGQGLLNPSGATCQAVGFLPAWNLNLPSLTAEVVGVQTLVRTVTHVGSAPATYNASVSLPGFTTTVTPSTLTLAPGQQGTFTVNVRRTSATVGSWAFGTLDWTDGAQTVRSPLTFKPLYVSAPAQIDDTLARSSRRFTIATGYDGTMRNSTIGLVPAQRSTSTVAVNASNCSTTVTVPAGAQWLRVALYNRDSTGQGADDLDLRVLNAAGTVVGSSGGPTTDELVQLLAPAAGTYTVCVDGYAPLGGSSTYTLSTWVGTPAQAIANALRVVTPLNVVTAGTGTVSFAWTVTAGNRFYTTVQYLDGSNNAEVGRTGLLIDTVPPLAPAPLASAATAASPAAQQRVLDKLAR